MPVLPNQPLNSTSTGSGLSSQLVDAASNIVTGAVGNPYNVGSRINSGQMFAYTTTGPGGYQTVGPSRLVNFPQVAADWRVRISLPPGATYFNNTLLSPLKLSSAYKDPLYPNENDVAFNAAAALLGQSQPTTVVFPYTPNVQITHTANYTSQKLTHNNYAHYYYDNSEVQSINLTGEFTVQNITEGQYLLATIYFFRTITKMFFGQDPLAGNPPPIVYLNGYGKYYLPNVPCVVTSFQHTMPDSVDYVEIPEPTTTGVENYNLSTNRNIGATTRLPTTSSITVSLQPVYSRLGQSQNFSLQDFAAGYMINSYNPASATVYGTNLLGNKFPAGGKPSNGGFI